MEIGRIFLRMRRLIGGKESILLPRRAIARLRGRASIVPILTFRSHFMNPFFQNRIEPPALIPTGGVVLAPLEYPPLRVMVVDDNRDAADSLGKLFTMVGFTTRVHHCPVEALADAEEFLPEACILDLTMPKMDGCELAKALRLQRPLTEPLLLVAVTALSAKDQVERTRAAGMNRHIVKPADPQELLNLLFDYERAYRTSSASND